MAGDWQPSKRSRHLAGHLDITIGLNTEVAKNLVIGGSSFSIRATEDLANPAILSDGVRGYLRRCRDGVPEGNQIIPRLSKSILAAPAVATDEIESRACRYLPATLQPRFPGAKRSHCIPAR